MSNIRNRNITKSGYVQKANQITYFQATRPVEKKETETDRNTQTHTQKHKKTILATQTKMIMIN